MSIGAFTAKTHRPTESQVRKTIGAMFPAWQALDKFIRENYSVQEDFVFLYGKNYGWATRLRIKGKLLTALYPTQDGFTVQIILNPAAIEQAQKMKPGKNVQAAIARANPYPEGRWLFIPIETQKDLKDVKRLLPLRAEPRKGAED